MVNGGIPPFRRDFGALPRWPAPFIDVQIEMQTFQYKELGALHRIRTYGEKLHFLQGETT